MDDPFVTPQKTQPPPQSTPLQRSTARKKAKKLRKRETNGGFIYIVRFDVAIECRCASGMLEEQALLKVGSSGSVRRERAAQWATCLDRLYYHMMYNNSLQSHTLRRPDEHAFPSMARPQTTAFRGERRQLFKAAEESFFDGISVEEKRPELVFERVVEDMCRDPAFWRNAVAFLHREAVDEDGEQVPLTEAESLIRSFCGTMVPQHVANSLCSQTASGDTEFVLVPRSMFLLLRAGFEELVRVEDTPYVSLSRFVRFLTSLRNLYTLYANVDVYFRKTNGSVLHWNAVVLSETPPTPVPRRMLDSPDTRLCYDAIQRRWFPMHNKQV